MLNKSNSLIKNDSVIACQVKSDKFSTNHKVIKKISKIKNSSSDIDSFAEKIKSKDFTYDYINYDFPSASRKMKIIDNNNDSSSIFIKNNEFLGDGLYGSAFKVGNFVIKIPMRNFMMKEFILKEPFANYDRCSRILNTVNEDENFSRSVTFDNGLHALVTKYIDGKSVVGDEAIQFVKSRGYIIHDFNSDGNVRVKDDKLVLIDADNVTRPYKERRNSIGSEFFYRQYPGKIRNG